MAIVCSYLTEADASKVMEGLSKFELTDGVNKDSISDYLQIYIQYYEKDASWLPSSSDDYSDLAWFINNIATQKIPSYITRDALFKNYRELREFTPEELDGYLDMLSRSFALKLDALEKAIPGKSRVEILKSIGTDKGNGYAQIMNAVFNEYERLYTKAEERLEKFKKEHPDATAEQIEETKDFYEEQADVFNRILEHKEVLATYAAARIGEDEGFVVSFKDSGIDFSELDSEQISLNNTNQEEETHTDEDEEVKGDRYVDFRTVKILNTLSPRVKRLLRSIVKLDSSGNLVVNSAGVVQYLSPRQSSLVLSRVLVNSTPKTMMSDLRDAKTNYPWLGGLIQKLESDTDLQTLIFCNFKKAETTYVENYKRGSHYEQHIVNSRASSNAIIQEAGINMTSGFVLDEDYSLYTKQGTLVSGERIKQYLNDFQKKVKNAVMPNHGAKQINLVEGTKGLAEKYITKVKQMAEAEGKSADYLDLEPAEAMDGFFAEYPEVLPTLTKMLRGAGIDVSEDDVRAMSKQTMTPRAFSILADLEQPSLANTPNAYGPNKLYQLVKYFENVLLSAKDIQSKNTGATGQYLYNSLDGLKKINSCIALTKYEDRESRVSRGNSSLGTYNNVNLLHQVIDKLSGKEDAEDYDKMLKDDYLQYQGMALGYGDELRATGWLKYLQDNTNNMRGMLRVLDSVGFNNVDYTKLTSAQKATNALLYYLKGGHTFRDSRYAAYEVPIQSDYSSAYNFIVAPILNTEIDENGNSELITALCEEVAIEVERIAELEERLQMEGIPHPEVLESEGMKFHIFPAFNTNGFREKYKSLGDAEAAEFLRTQVREQLAEVIKKDKEYLEKSGALKNKNLSSVQLLDESYSFYTEDGLVDSLGEDEQAKLNEFFLNVFYARQQMVKIFTGGMEQFNGLIDYEKRNMLLHATHSSLYTEATYKGKKVGKTSQTVVYIKDDCSKSKFYDEIKGLLKSLRKEKLITPRQYKTMLDNYKYITTTDGVGLRTLDSYREVMLMSNPDLWTERHETAYNHIKQGKPTTEDVQVMLNMVKPVMSGYETLPAASDTQKPIRLTVLHKYAEQVLLPVELAKYCITAKSAPLNAIAEAQERLSKEGKNVDLFLFTSGCKVGMHSAINPFAKDGNKPDGRRLRSTKTTLADYIVNEISSNPYTLHTFDYKYYGIAASTTAHATDSQIAWASQAEKVAWANIREGDKVYINGEEWSAIDARNKYYEIKTSMIIDSYKELRNMFANKYELERILQEELASRSYTSDELKYALSLLDTGEFAMPLFSPGIEHDIEALFTSIMKKRLTKPKGLGSNILQSTGLGLDVELENFSEDDSVKDEDKLGLIKTKEDGYAVEASVPTPKALLRFADNTGAIDAKRLRHLVESGIIPESILEFVAYRTPSDAEHSVIPCKIKYFTSPAEGATIRLPKEIMKMTGHDYDGDKLRCHFKNYILKKNDIVGAAWKYYVSAQDYDYSKSPFENSIKARESARVEFIFAELSSPEGFKRVVIPGGCDETKVYAKTIHIMQQLSDDNKKIVAEELVRQDAANDSIPTDNKISIQQAREIVADTEKLYDTLVERGDDCVSGILKALSSSETPFSFAHSQEAYEYIIRNSEMIGIYAMYNSSFQMFQRMNIKYTSPIENKTINILGNEIGNGKTLFSVRNSNGQLSSLSLARLLNAAVDNGKDPILGYVNQSADMAPLTMLLLASGMSEEDVHLVLNQPIILELSRRLTNNATASQKEKLNDIAEEILNEMRNVHGFTESMSVPLKVLSGNKGAVSEVAKMTKGDFIAGLSKSFDDIDSNKDLDFFIQQGALLRLIQHLSTPANILREFVSITRPDSQSGAFGSSVASIIIKNETLNDFRRQISEDGFPFDGMRDVIAEKKIFEGLSSDELMSRVNTALPEVTSLLSLLTESSVKTLRNYFPQLGKSWMDVATEISNKYDFSTTQEGVVKKVVREMILYKLLGNSKFATGNVEEEKRQLLFGDETHKSVPTRLQELKSRIAKAETNPGSDEAAEMLIGNLFIRNLGFTSYENRGEGRATRLKFNLNGPAIERTVDTIKASWADMLYIGDEEIKQLAIDLFKYNIYSNGLNYGLYEFYHLAPIDVINAVPGYLDAMKDILYSGEWTNAAEVAMFKNQYFRNHWYEDKLVPSYRWESFHIEPRQADDAPGLHRILSNPVVLSQLGGRDYVRMLHEDKEYLFMVTPVLETDANGKTSISQFLLQFAEPLGDVNYNKQVSVYYNPKVTSLKDLHKIVHGDKPTLGEVTDLNYNTEGNIDAEGQNEEYSVAGVDNIGDIVGNVDSAKYEDARKKQEEDLLLASFMAGASKEELAALNTFHEKVEEADEQNSREEATGLTDEDLKRMFLENNVSGPLFHIAKVNESGKTEVEVMEESLDSVKLARRQRAYRILGDRIREILREFNMNVGALTEAEARMGVYGVTNFDRMEVTARGIEGIIRIANGFEGELALPEEFGHVSLEMLGYDNALVSRLMTVLRDNRDALLEAFDGQYADYLSAYSEYVNREMKDLSEDERAREIEIRMLKEAAGKLVARQMFENREIVSPKTKSLVRRIIDWIKEQFRKIPLFRIQNAISEANDAASQIARGLLSGTLLDQMSTERLGITKGDLLSLKKAKEDLSKKNDVLSKILKVELKRLQILKRRVKDIRGTAPQEAIERTEQQIANLEDAIKNYKVEDALTKYMQNSITFLSATLESLEAAYNSDKLANKKCRKLIAVRDTTQSYASVITAINEAARDKEIVLTDEMRDLKESITSQINKINSKCDEYGLNLFEHALAGVYGEEGITIAIGKERGRHISIHEMATRGDGDISILSRFIHSMADCNDFVLRAIDAITGKAKRLARRKTLEIKTEIENAVSELEKATGSRDTSFMFEKARFDGGDWCNGAQDDGKLHKTGKYISKEKAVYLPKPQKKFYDTMMAIKAEADLCVPVSFLEKDKIVMLRKYTYEKYKDAKGIKGKFTTMWEGLKNAVMEGPDVDVDREVVSIDFQNNKVDALPIKFMYKGKSEQYDDMTDDVATSILTYAGMANEYNELSNVIGILENAHYMASQRDILKNVGRKQRVEVIDENGEKTFTNKVTVKQAITNLQKVLDDFFIMHVYGHVQANEGTIGRTRISTRKLVNVIKKIVSYSQMALNLPQRVSNVNTGLTMIAVETAGKGKFNIKDVAWANKIIMANAADRLAETGNTDYDNKLSKFSEYFDILQTNGRDIPSYNRGKLSRIFNTSLLFSGLAIGEDYLANLTALSVARNFKVKNAEGKTETLWDAYEVRYKNPAGKSGAYLALKNGYTKEDGSAITTEDEDKFADDVKALNFELQGIYNLDDRSAMQQYSFGALLIMYRKWIAPALKRRYQGMFSNRPAYSVLKGEFEEGYYTTLFRLLSDPIFEKQEVSEEESQEVVAGLVSNIKAYINSVQLNWDNLTDYEKMNIRKASTELSIILGLFATAFLLSKLPPDDHNGNETLKWADNFIMVQILRLRTEIGAMSPSPMMLEEGLRILNSPFAAIGPLRDSLKIFQLAVPSNYVTEVKAGRYRGRTKAYKYFRELPIISMFKKIDNFVDPTPLLHYYENDVQ